MTAVENAPSGGLGRHLLPLASFDMLASGSGDPAIVGSLWTSERSRRLLLLKALLDEADQHPELLGPLPPAADAWEVLISAQAVAAEAVDSILLHPQVGGWAAYSLRRLRGGAKSDLPLWVDFGGIHALALTAAARAGLTWETQLPLRRGQAILPTLGLASFPDSPSAAVAQGETQYGRVWLLAGGCKVEVPADHMADADGWYGLRRLQVGDDIPLTVWLDDLDPFRDLGYPVSADRLSDADVGRWRAVLADAWDLLCHGHPTDALAISKGVVSLVPLPPEDGWDTRSASSGEAFGAVMVSTPPDPETLAVALVHEFQHVVLGALLHLVQLVRENDPAPGAPKKNYYAPWRDDSRPLGGLLQGVYAFLGIARFWRRHRLSVSGAEAALAHYEYGYARGQTHEALGIMRSAGDLTERGRALIDGLDAELAPWMDEPLPAEIARMVALTADSHRVRWRLRHFHPTRGEARQLADAWAAGEQAVIGSMPQATESDAGTRWSREIPDCARRWAIATGRPEGVAIDRRSLDGRASANAALVAGEYGSAREGYLSCIMTDKSDLDAWTGLALTVQASESGPASIALLDRPDLVRAVHAELAGVGRAVDPVELAAWLGSSSGSA